MSISEPVSISGHHKSLSFTPYESHQMDGKEYHLFTLYAVGQSWIWVFSLPHVGMDCHCLFSHKMSPTISGKWRNKWKKMRTNMTKIIFIIAKWVSAWENDWKCGHLAPTWTTHWASCVPLYIGGGIAGMQYIHSKRLEERHRLAC